MAIPGTVRRPGPAAESIPPGPLPKCDATASGSEDGQVQLARGLLMLTLCAHHAAEYGLALVAAGWHVTRDDRAALVVQQGDQRDNHAHGDDDRHDDRHHRVLG
jgi:hypothetical protein